MTKKFDDENLVDDFINDFKLIESENTEENNVENHVKIKKETIEIIKNEYFIKNDDKKDLNNKTEIDFKIEIVDYDFNDETINRTNQTIRNKNFIGIDSPHFSNISIMAQRFNKIDNIDEWKDYIKKN